jgi:hypothetical protein
MASCVITLIRYVGVVEHSLSGGGLLATSVADGPEEESLCYRSLIQELRILLHKPFATHPNLLQILDLSWELDPAGTQRWYYA